MAQKGILSVGTQLSNLFERIDAEPSAAERHRLCNEGIGMLIRTDRREFRPDPKYRAAKKGKATPVKKSAGVKKSAKKSATRR